MEQDGVEEGKQVGGGPRYALRRKIPLTPKAKGLAETIHVAHARSNNFPASPTPTSTSPLHPDLVSLDEETLHSLSFDRTSDFDFSLTGSTGADKDNAETTEQNVEPRDLCADFLGAQGFQSVVLPAGPSPPNANSDSDPFISPRRSSSSSVPTASPNGRPTNAAIAELADTYIQVDKLFSQASVRTGRSVHDVRTRYMSKFKSPHHEGLFNLYERYHASFTRKEVERSGIVNGTNREYYESYIAEYGELSENLMRAALDLNRILNKKETQAQRARLFEKHRQRVNNINAEGALNRIHTFSLIVGECLHEDGNLYAIEATPGLVQFTQRLGLDENTTIGLGKITVYDYIGKHITESIKVDKILEDVKNALVAPEASTTSKTPTETSMPDVDLQADDVIPGCKAALGSLLKARGDVINVDVNLLRVPWTTLPTMLVKLSAYLQGWPPSVPFPTETGKGKGKGEASQGIKDLGAQHGRVLLDALINKQI
ncbi:hypothetical protein C0991_001574, partial [Blastosporella zonata]